MDKTNVHFVKKELIKEEDEKPASEPLPARLGFRRQTTPWRKPDPRGAEYGHFEVEIRTAVLLVLRKYDSDGCRHWGCIFESEQDFKEWAEANT